MLRITLVQPGSTDFDDQGRIKGSLDIPLSHNGSSQVERTVKELASFPFDAIYSSPCESAVQTALELARGRGIRAKRIKKLRNLDHGLWHGKLIEEVRQTQPRVYRQCRNHPETVCPPEGESVVSAKKRVRSALTRILRRHRCGTVALVIPEPLASFVRSYLQDHDICDFWKAELDAGGWTMIDVRPSKIAGNWLTAYGRAVTGA